MPNKEKNAKAKITMMIEKLKAIVEGVFGTVSDDEQKKKIYRRMLVVEKLKAVSYTHLTLPTKA